VPEYTLREASEAIGRRLYPHHWTGSEFEIIESNRPLLPLTTREEKLAPSSPEETAAMEKREAARLELANLIQRGMVDAWIVYDDGNRRDIPPHQWEALKGPLRLSYRLSRAGFMVYEGDHTFPDGKIWIDGAQLDACLPNLARKSVSRAQRKAVTNEKHIEWAKLAKAEVEGENCPMYRDKPNKREIARRVRRTGGFKEDSVTILTFLKRHPDLWCRSDR